MNKFSAWASVVAVAVCMYPLNVSADLVIDATTQVVDATTMQITEGYAYIGQTDETQLNVINGGVVEHVLSHPTLHWEGWLYIGKPLTAIGALNVSGSGSRVDNFKGVFAGGDGFGQIRVTDGGVVRAQDIGAGGKVGGQLIVRDPGSMVLFERSLAGYVEIRDGGAAGQASDPQGTVTPTLINVIGSGSGLYAHAVALGLDDQRGYLNVLAGGRVESDSLGSEWSGGGGDVLADGLGSTLDTRAANIGYAQRSTVTIRNGAQWITESTRLGWEGAEVEVIGLASTWQASNALTIGWGGYASSVNIWNGASLTSGFTVLGVDAQQADLTVGGRGTRWNATQSVTVGNASAATLTIREQAQGVCADIMEIGGGYGSGLTLYVRNGSGVVRVTDSGSKLTVDGELYVGRGGQGSMYVVAGGRVSSGDGMIGTGLKNNMFDDSDSTGFAYLTAPNSRWDIAGSLYLGGQTTRRAIGQLVIEDGAMVTADQMALIWPDSSIKLRDGTLTVPTVDNRGRISGPGTITGAVANAGVFGGQELHTLPDITGDFTQSTAGHLMIPFVGTADGQYAQLLVTGIAELAGVIELLPYGGAAWALGDEFDVVFAQSIVDSGLRVELGVEVPSLGAELYLHHRILPTPAGEVLNVVVVPEPVGTAWLLGVGILWVRSRRHRHRRISLAA